VPETAVTVWWNRSDREQASVSSSASFSLRPLRDAVVSAGSRGALLHDPHYAYSWEDLHEIANSIADWDGEDGAPPTAGSLSWAARIIARTQEIVPAPEVSSLENGTVLLLWKMSGGFFSVEIGDDKYGLIGLRDGFPSVRMNGQAADLIASIPAPRSAVRSVDSSASDWRRVVTTRVSGMRSRLDVSGSSYVHTF